MFPQKEIMTWTSVLLAFVLTLSLFATNAGSMAYSTENRTADPAKATIAESQEPLEDT